MLFCDSFEMNFKAPEVVGLCGNGALNSANSISSDSDDYTSEEDSEDSSDDDVDDYNENDEEVASAHPSSSQPIHYADRENHNPTLRDGLDSDNSAALLANDDERINSTQFAQGAKQNDNDMKRKPKTENDVIETTIIFNRNLTNPAVNDGSQDKTTWRSKQDYEVCEDRIRQYFDKWAKCTSEKLSPTASRECNKEYEKENEYEKINEYEEISEEENMNLTITNKSSINSDEDDPYEPITWFDNEKKSKLELVSKTENDSLKSSLYDNKPASCTTVAVPAVFVELWEGKENDDHRKSSIDTTGKTFNRAEREPTPFFIDPEEKSKTINLLPGKKDNLLNTNESNRYVRELTPFFKENLNTSITANQINQKVIKKSSESECERGSFKHKSIFQSCNDKLMVSDAKEESHTLQLPDQGQHPVRGPRESTPFLTAEDKENQNFVKSSLSKRIPGLSLSLSSPSSPDSSCPSSPQTPSSPPSLSVPSLPDVKPREQRLTEAGQSDKTVKGQNEQKSTEIDQTERRSRSMTRRRITSVQTRKVTPIPRGESPHHPHYYNHQTPRSSSLSPDRLTQMRSLKTGPNLSGAPLSLSQPSARLPRMSFTQSGRPVPEQTMELPRGKTIRYRSSSLDSRNSCISSDVKVNSNIGDSANLSIKKSISLTSFKNTLQTNPVISVPKEDCKPCEKSSKTPDISAKSVKPPVTNKSKKALIDVGNKMKRAALSAYQAASAVTHRNSSKSQNNSKEDSSDKQCDPVKSDVKNRETKSKKMERQGSLDKFEKPCDPLKSDVKNQETKSKKMQRQGSLDKFDSKPSLTEVGPKGMIKSFSFPSNAIAKTAQSIRNSAQSLNAFTNNKQNECSDKGKRNKNTSKQSNTSAKSSGVLTSAFDETLNNHPLTTDVNETNQANVTTTKASQGISDKISKNKSLKKDEEPTTSKNVITFGKTKIVPARNDLKTSIPTPNHNVKYLDSEEICSSKIIPEHSEKRYNPVSSNFDDAITKIGLEETSISHDTNASSTICHNSETLGIEKQSCNSSFPNSQPPLSTSLNLDKASSSKAELDVNSAVETSSSQSKKGKQQKSFVNKDNDKGTCNSEDSSLTRKLSDKLLKYRKKIFSEKKDNENATENVRPTTDNNEPNEGVRNNQSTFNLEKYSPFGPYTVEGLLCVLLATVFCLYLKMPGEVFICYIMACYCIFCIFRIAKLIR